MKQWKHLFEENFISLPSYVLPIFLVGGCRLTICNFSSIYDGKNKWYFNKMTEISLLYKSKIVIVLVHWNNNPQVDMSLHSNVLSWLRASLSECVAEKQQIPILIFFGFTWSGLEPTFYHTPDEIANHYTTDVVVYNIVVLLFVLT